MKLNIAWEQNQMIKKAGNDTSALEREIDAKVYGLYGLSEEEILIVEGK
jgi:hypothetical protein